MKANHPQSTKPKTQPPCHTCNEKDVAKVLLFNCLQQSNHFLIFEPEANPDTGTAPSDERSSLAAPNPHERYIERIRHALMRKKLLPLDFRRSQVSLDHNTRKQASNILRLANEAFTNDKLR
eukprot:6472212-Amphidinium_carterae.1